MTLCGKGSIRTSLDCLASILDLEDVAIGTRSGLGGDWQREDELSERT
jgi:hypothetical protein